VLFVTIVLLAKSCDVFVIRLLLAKSCVAGCQSLCRGSILYYLCITKPGLGPGFVMYKGIPIAIVRLRHKKTVRNMY